MSKQIVKKGKLVNKVLKFGKENKKNLNCKQLYNKAEPHL